MDNTPIYLSPWNVVVSGIKSVFIRNTVGDWVCEVNPYERATNNTKLNTNLIKNAPELLTSFQKCVSLAENSGIDVTEFNKLIDEVTKCD